MSLFFSSQAKSISTGRSFEKFLLDPWSRSWIEVYPDFLSSEQIEAMWDIMTGIQLCDAHHSRAVYWFGPNEYSYGRGERQVVLPANDISTSPWLLRSLLAKVWQTTGANYNSCLINYYESHRQFIPPHQDNESLFGRRPTIASVSIGATRRFLVQPFGRIRGLDSEHTFQLTNGCLLVMGGRCQEEWLHSVPREEFECGPRLNFTFRDVVIM